jgi:hypothetical protein
MIQINIIAHNTYRFPFTSKSIDFLKKIKDCNKSKIKILICYSNPTDFDLWENKKNDLIVHKLNAESICINELDRHVGNTYMNKIHHFIKSDCEYSCSMDDDILISNYLWDYIIENIKILDDEKNLFISPLISNGIPSVDLFLEDFCDDNQINIMHNIFKNTYIDNFWGVDYSNLNVKSDKWDGSFYDRVKTINHHYKGIHPIRVSLDAHVEMAKIICNNYNKILEPNNYRLECYQFPYFCNSFFFIKTKTWKKIIEDKSLFRDEYDEVPLNLYKEKNNLNMVLIRNGYCIHMAYNTINHHNQKIN